MSGEEKIEMPDPEEIDRAVEHIVEEGLGKGTAAEKKRRKLWLRALGGAAVLALVLAALIPLFKRTSAREAYPGITAMLAERPAATAEKLSADEFEQSEKGFRWASAQKEKAAVSLPLQEGMRPYYERLIAQMLSGQEENAVCSPVSIYLALSMLAEVTDGNTRQQILDLLNVADTETLRKNVSAIWESNYADAPGMKSLLANSFWLREFFPYNRSTLKRLADSYYADSFIGMPGSDVMDKALQKWTDENTGGLLSEYTKDLKLDDDTVLALVSVLYFNTSWELPFFAKNNTQGVFHGAHGDTKAEMMHKENPMDVYEAEHFTSVAIPLKNSGFVYICLPKEGTDAAALAADPELMDIVHENDHWTSGYNRTVRLSLPKFTVSGKTDLRETLRALGVTDVMDDRLADFTPLTERKEDAQGLYLGNAEHAAKLSIDEEGVIGAAYTFFMIPAAAWPEAVEFTVDRPFFFLVTGQDNSILFAGVVNDIEE